MVWWKKGENNRPFLVPLLSLFAFSNPPSPPFSNCPSRYLVSGIEPGIMKGNFQTGGRPPPWKEIQMQNRSYLSRTIGLLTVFALTLVLCLSSQEDPPTPPQKVSSPGKYEGYSAPVYSEWVRFSQYIPARDGTKLAIDIYRPSVGGKPLSEPLPVISTVTPYRRAFKLPD